MDVDESFAEHVSVRWSTLYRLAVLLAGTERADDLIQAALARAFASWRTVREAASPDAALRKILVNTSVDSTDSAAGDATRSGVARDDEEPWSRTRWAAPEARSRRSPWPPSRPTSTWPSSRRVRCVTSWCAGPTRPSSHRHPSTRSWPGVTSTAVAG